MCDHNHSYGAGCCDHGDLGNDNGYSLYQKINTTNLECLNELVDGSGAKVFKPWSNRLDKDDYVQSDCDAELIFNIPFTGDVKLKGVVVIADEELHKMRLFKSNVSMSFDDITAEADQEFEITHDPEGLLEYPVKPTRFSNVHHLSIHFTNKNVNDDSKPCLIYYIGLKGEFTRAIRDAVVIANYELRPTEHVSQDTDQITREVQ